MKGIFRKNTSKVKRKFPQITHQLAEKWTQADLEKDDDLSEQHFYVCGSLQREALLVWLQHHEQVHRALPRPRAGRRR